jgi:predicted transcriptional regulator
MNIISLEDVIGCLADIKALQIFTTVAKGDGESDVLKKSLGYSRKQFYSRTSNMLKIGLVKRKKGKLLLTAFGSVVYHAEFQIEKAVKNYWKLKAVDSIQSSKQISVKERSKIIKSVINDEKLERILLER